jgi:hypothetical protein
MILFSTKKLAKSAGRKQGNQSMSKFTSFEKSLLTTFKKFVHDDTLHIQLDFRKHVFLENQYGNYPEYKYSIGERIVDCIFSFLDKHRVDYSGRYNRSMMIESLRTTKLSDFIVNELTYEIDEDLLKVMSVKVPPKFKITGVSISSYSDNCCLCVNVDENTADFICKRLNIAHDRGGDGCDGFINIQFPISNESQTYIAGGNWEDDIKGYFDDEVMVELVSSIVYEGKGFVSLRDFELEKLFGTSNIKTHDNGVLHGYYNGLSLSLLENLDTDEAYVTFECGTWEQKEYFPCHFKTFESLKDAKSYIRSHCENFQTLQDFGISHAIFNDIEPIPEY